MSELPARATHTAQDDLQEKKGKPMLNAASYLRNNEIYFHLVCENIHFRFFLVSSL